MRRLPLAALARGFAPFLVAFGTYLAVYLVMQPETTGDEPHYLIVAQSLARDGDLDVANDYASVERTLAVAESFPLDPHADRYTSDDFVPVHGLGLSVVLLPAMALGGATLARLTMILIAAVLAYQLYALLLQVGIVNRLYRWLAWAAAALCLPLVAFSNQIYPEVPAALLVVIALRVLLLPRPRPRLLLIGALAAAALPWLNVRYLAISFAIFLGLAYVACRSSLGRVDVPAASVVRRAWSAADACVTTIATRRRDVGGAIVLPFAVSLGALGGVFEALYGSPLPAAPYRPRTEQTIGSSGWDFWYEMLLGDILHPAVGWIPYAPVHWLGLAGIGCLVWRFGGAALAVLAAIVVHLFLVASTGVPIGFSFPARYLLIFIPLVAIPLAVVLVSVRPARLVFLPLFLGSLLFAAAATFNYTDLFPMPTERATPARLVGVRSIQTAFPDTRPNELPTSFVVSPGDAPPQVGRLDDGRVIASDRLADPPGFVLFGPYAPLETGIYRAIFSLEARDTQDDAVVARVEAIASPERVLAQRTVRASDLDEGPSPTSVVLPFATPGGFPIETRVYYEGEGTLVAGPIEVAPEQGTHVPAETFPDWPLAFVWVAGTVVIGALFVEVTRRRLD